MDSHKTGLFFKPHTLFFLLVIEICLNPLGADEHSRLLGNMESACRFFLHIGTEFLIVLQNVLILVAVAGEDIRDQWFRLRDQEGILIEFPSHFLKIGGQDLSTVLPSKFIIKFIR